MLIIQEDGKFCKPVGVAAGVPFDPHDTIAGGCQQTFENKKFVDFTQKCFDKLTLVNFPANNLNFHRIGSNQVYFLKSFLLYLVVSNMYIFLSHLSDFTRLYF